MFVTVVVRVDETDVDGVGRLCVAEELLPCELEPLALLLLALLLRDVEASALDVTTSELRVDLGASPVRVDWEV